MKAFYSDTHRQHQPPFEIVEGGQRSAYLESPARMDSILRTLRDSSWAQIQEPTDFGLEPIRAVHSEGYLDFLASAWNEWLETHPVTAGAPAEAFLPATFALRRSEAHKPTSLLGRAGYYVMDLASAIVAGTYKAALASANCALSAAETVAEGERADLAALGLCRPPGHHAGRDYAAGYCYINNAAVAAQRLSRRGKVAVIDVDYHAGNGTQDIFYGRADVLTVSLHADPAEEYPYYAGYSDEIGSGQGRGFHRNYPLATGTDNVSYLAALDSALEAVAGFSPLHIVVSVGFDIYEDDPLGRFKITTEGIRAIGEGIAGLRLPTVLILEGGYNTDELGGNLSAFLSAFEARSP